MAKELQPKIQDSDLFKELLAEGLAIQDRFSAEPIFAKTGKGHLESAGVSELEELKSKRKASRGTN